MIDHDRLFKELLTTFFFEFIELFFPQVAAYMEREPLQFLDKEIFTDVTAGDKHEVDIIVKAKFRGEDSCFLLHVENQAKPQGDFNKRMHGYFSRLLEKHDLPVYPVALFSYDKPRRPEPNRYRIAFPDFEPLLFRYRVIQLNRLNWRDFIRQENPIASALMSKMRIEPKDRPKVKAECLRLLTTLKLDRARMRLISGFVDSYLRLNAEEEQAFQAELQTIEPEQKEIAMEIVTSWMEEGIERGMKQGLEQGKEQIVLRLLRKRFGDISEELEGRVRALSEERTEALADALLDFQDRAEFEAWLAAQ